MRLGTLILRNLIRRGVRTALTVVGLGIGIAAVVALVGIAWGFERSFTQIYTSKGIDLVVVRAGSSTKLTSSLDEQLGATLRAVPGVKEVAGSLVDVVSFEEANLVSVLANGWEPASLLFRGIRILRGRSLVPGDRGAVLLGRVLALNLGKTVGDKLAVAGEPFTVVGLFESDSLFENGGLILPRAVLQKMMGREGDVTGFVVSAADGGKAAIESLKARIERAVPGIAAVPARDYIQGDIQMRLARSMAWATSAVALILGSVGVLNTMLMAVFERTGEIGLLRALGWRRRRVLTLFLGEAIALGLAGALVGAAFGNLGVRALASTPTASGFIAADLPPAAYAVGLGMGVGLSLLGGLYPALRGAALNPIEALRHG